MCLIRSMLVDFLELRYMKKPDTNDPLLPIQARDLSLSTPFSDTTSRKDPLQPHLLHFTAQASAKQRNNPLLYLVIPCFIKSKDIKDTCFHHLRNGDHLPARNSRSCQIKKWLEFFEEEGRIIMGYLGPGNILNRLRNHLYYFRAAFRG
jgi:hypothetical protein